MADETIEQLRADMQALQTRINQLTQDVIDARASAQDELGEARRELLTLRSTCDKQAAEITALVAQGERTAAAIAQLVEENAKLKAPSEEV